MRLGHVLTVALLLSISVPAQNPGRGSTSTQTVIRGITILLSSFDSSTLPQTVRLDFVNNTNADITAWGYCVKVEKINSEDPNQGFCALDDPVPGVVNWQVQQRMTCQPVTDSPGGDFVHPGEHKILSYSFGYPVLTAEIQIKLIAFSDGKVELSEPDGLFTLRTMITYREQELKRIQELITMGRKILADPADRHPAISMIKELQNPVRADNFMEGTLYLFK